MAASVDAAPLECDLADRTAELVVHVELQCVRLVALHDHAVARRGVSLPLGATIPASLVISSPESHERR
jgi:hypothetical protein